MDRASALPTCGLVVALLSAISTLQADSVPLISESRPAGIHASRVLLKPKASMKLSVGPQLRRMHARNGARLMKNFADIGGLQVLELPRGVSIRDAIESYRASGLVEYAEPDYDLQIAAEPDDPEYANGQQWFLHNIGRNEGVADADIDAPEGWAVCREAPEVIVAVIDTGIRETHEDLADNLWTNPGEIPGNGIDDDGNGYVDDVHGINALTRTADISDDNGHGTHVAGIIGALGNNGRGGAGVARRVKLMICKAMGPCGVGSVSDAVACIQYARAQGAHVINASWGTALGYPEGLKEAVDAAAKAEIIFVCGAGNNFQDTDGRPFFPASYPCDNLVAVLATTRSDELAGFSNFGQVSVAIAAPGHEILSTLNNSDSSYGLLSGTSMATPVVSGVFALMRAHFPEENYLRLINRVYASVDKVAALEAKCRTAGRVNLARSLTSRSSRPPNDDFAARSPVNLGSFSTRGINVDATGEDGEPAHPAGRRGRSIWWAWRPPTPGVARINLAGSTFEPLLTVFSGSELASLQFITANQPDSLQSATNVVEFPVDGGAEYAIAVDGRDGAMGSVVLNVMLASRPSNDEFANRLGITGSPSSVAGSNTLATVEPAEPAHTDNASGNSIWWTWTPTRSGPVSITTAGSDFDTALAVYTGEELTNLTWIGSNDDDPAAGSTTSRVDFEAIAGTAYQIAVDGRNGSAGNVLLHTPPLNDNFADRMVLTAANCAVSAVNVLATREVQDPVIDGKAGGKSLWWSWTARVSGRTSILTVGSSFDTLLGVYTGLSLDSLTAVGVNDNDPYGNFTSLVTFDAAAGTTYAIAVDGAPGAAGKIQLTIGTSEYAISELAPAPGYTRSSAVAVNSSGIVVGASAIGGPKPKTQACIWTRSNAVQLICSEADGSYANDINDLNQVVGFYFHPTNGKLAFLWQNGVRKDLAEPWSNSEAEGIDNAGRVVGRRCSPTGRLHAFMWHDGVTTELGALGTDTGDAFALNEWNLVVGNCLTEDASLTWPVVWRNFILEKIVLPRTVLQGAAMSVNALSQVVGGYVDAEYLRHAFLWENGHATEFDQGYANSINNLGQIVGWDFKGPEGEKTETAVLWRDGTSTNLVDLLPPDSGWSLWWGRRISDWGQIVGSGTFKGETRGFIATPTSAPSSRPILVSPADQQTFRARKDIHLAAHLVPSAAGVLRVDYFAGETLIGTATNPPYTIAWQGAAEGDHTLSARTVNVSGGTRSSQLVRITVKPAVDTDGDGLPDAWEAQHDLNLDDPTDALADAKGDGQCNLVKYAFGSEPAISSDGGNSILSVVRDPASTGFLTVQFKRRKQSPTLQYIPEVSPDLCVWEAGWEEVKELSVTPLDDDFDLVTVRDMTPANRGSARFLRVRLAMRIDTQ